MGGQCFENPENNLALILEQLFKNHKGAVLY